MRTIKFRVWDKHDKKYITGNRIAITLDGNITSFDDDHMSYPIPVRHEDNDVLVFQQFTGLLDKNGKGVYEGDIMPSMGIPLVVEFFNGGFIARNKQDAAFNSNWGDMEVIGNIYENPELMEGKS